MSKNKEKLVEMAQQNLLSAAVIYLDIVHGDDQDGNAIIAAQDADTGKVIVFQLFRVDENMTEKVDTIISEMADKFNATMVVDGTSVLPSKIRH